MRDGVAGADLSELAKISTAEAYRIGWLKDLEEGFSSFRKPIIAAVRGFAVSISNFSFEASLEATFSGCGMSSNKSGFA